MEDIIITTTELRILIALVENELQVNDSEEVVTLYNKLLDIAMME